MGIGICCRNTPLTEENNFNEMKDGIVPKMDNHIPENNIDLKMSSSYNFISKENKRDTIESDYTNSDQQKSEKIFLFFNNLRNNPINYLSEAQKYNLNQILLTANEKIKNKKNIKNLIKNPFYDLFFEKSLKSSLESEENILSNIDKENLFTNYEKKLYIIEGNSENVEECVWLLIKKCYDNGDEILTKNIDYLVLTSISNDDNKKFLCYFLFLSSGKNSTINEID